MEIVLYELFTNYLSVEGIILIVQLLFSVYVIHGIIMLLTRNYGEKWVAFRGFKNNMLLGIGTKITIEVARQQFTGNISSATKDKIVISNNNDIVMIDMRTFMNMSVIIHNTTN